MKYGFVYIWYDKKRKMFYIGCHWGTEDDGYICSSNRMRDAYRRRPHDFKRRVVQKIFESRAALLEAEYNLLSKIKDSELGTKYYNARKFHFSHWTLKSNADKIAKKCAWQVGLPFNQQPHYGIPHSEETKKKISDAHKKRGTKPTWKVPPMTGKKHSAETKEKMSRRRQGIIFSNDTKLKMSISAKNRWLKGTK